MKVNINADGVINIIPENGIEMYALKEWSKTSKIYETDPKYAEEFYYKASKIIIWDDVV